MLHRGHQSEGSVTLVALCFVAVLGIALASYLAVSNQSMKLSDRSTQTGVGEQMAEMGLEEALRAFNKNDWSNWSSSPANVSSGAWTLDTTNHRASRTITFQSGKLGQGATGTIKIRIDNYDAAQLNSTWSSSANYRVNDLVGYSGTWYRCLQANTNQTPNGMVNLAYWVPAPISSTWSSNVTYKAQDVVYYTPTPSNGWYRCILAPTANQAPTNPTYWTAISRISIDNSYLSINGELLDWFGAWWYYTSSWNTTPPVVSWTWRSGYNYAFNDKVCLGYPAVWYRCILAHTSSGGGVTGPPPNGPNWEDALSGMWGWNSSSINYNLGDAVYYSSTAQWYRCILAHTSSGSITPTNTTYWSNAPLLSTAWDSGRQYSQNDTASYNGVWYLSLQNNNTGQNPATATAYWIGANTGTASYQWNSGTAYSAGNYRCYGGVWYKCISGNTGQSPNNTTYWTASWANASGITLGAPVIYAEGTVNLLDNTSTKTQIRATVAPAPLFPNALAATSTLTLGSGGTVDSFDSTLATSYAAQVGTATNYSAVLAGGNPAGTAVTVTTATVNGYVAAPPSSTSPYAPLFSYGGSAAVKSSGSIVSPSPTAANVDLTRVSRSPYIPQFDPQPAGGLTAAFITSNFPKGTLLSLSAATTNIGSPGATTPSRYYYNGDLTLSGSTPAILNINGPVILYINGNLIMDSGTPNGLININSTGSAEIHIAGSLTVNIGADGINNTTHDPKKLILICDTSSSAAQNYSDGTSHVYGVIYLPNTTNTSGLSLDTSTTILIYGAISAKKITYNGVDANLHYDTSLRYATFGGVDQPYSVTEWRQLTDAAEAATMP